MEAQLTAMTEKLYVPKLRDNVFNTNFLLSRFRKNQKSYDGGTQIAIHLEYAELPSGGSFTGLGLLDTAVGDIASLATYEWRQYYTTLGWSRRDYLINKGSKQKLVDLVESITNNASKKLQKLLTTGIFQASKAASTDIDGLTNAICAAGTTACGGLTSSDITAWAPQRDTTTTKLTLAAMNALYRDASDGPDATTVVVTDDNTYGFYYDIATPLQRYQNAEAADQGFSTLTFNGIPVVSDKSITAGYMYMLNEDHLWLVSHSDEDMRYESPKTPLNQSAELGQVFWMGNLVTDARRRQAILTGITS